MGARRKSSSSGNRRKPWQIAPHLSEQVYTMEDSLLFASMLMSFVRHSDRVKVACQSLLTNISATIMTEKGGEVWVQPVFYPFLICQNMQEEQ